MKIKSFAKGYKPLIPISHLVANDRRRKDQPIQSAKCSRGVRSENVRSGPFNVASRTNRSHIRVTHSASLAEAENYRCRTGDRDTEKELGWWYAAREYGEEWC